MIEPDIVHCTKNPWPDSALMAFNSYEGGPRSDFGTFTGCAAASQWHSKRGSRAHL